MRTHLSTPRSGRLKAAAAYSALIALMIAVFTTSGVVAAIAAFLMVSLLVGSYLLERWARRRIIYPPQANPSTTGDANIDETARMAKV